MSRYFVSCDGTVIDFDRVVVAHWNYERRLLRDDVETFCIWIDGGGDAPWEYQHVEAKEIANALSAYWHAKAETEPYR